MVKSLYFIFAAAIVVWLTISDQSRQLRCNSVLNRRITDSLRGIAILLVMIGHIGSAMSCQPVGTFGSFGVAIFLFLSGFGLNESFKKTGLKKYWFKKVKRVWIPHFIIITILGIFIYKFRFSQYLLEITGIKTTYWYVAFLIQWYVAFWLFTRFFERYRILLLTIFGIVVMFFFGRLPGEQAFNFVVGVVCSVYYDRISQLNRGRVVAIALSCFAVCAIAWIVKDLAMARYDFDHGCWQLNAMKSVIKLSACITIVGSVHIFPGVTYSRFLTFMGVMSFELYLLHYPFYTMLNGSVIWASVLVVGSILVGWLFKMFIDRLNPLMDRWHDSFFAKLKQK